MALLPGLWLAGCASPSPPNVTDTAAFSELTTPVPTSPVFPIGGPLDTGSRTNPPAPAHSPPPPRFNSFETRFTETWVPLQRWSRATGLATLTRSGGTPFPAVGIHSTNGLLVLHPGSQLASWEGMEVRLGFAPQWIDNQPYVHRLDLFKTILPLLQAEPAPCVGTRPIVVIDPGHGGENAGTKSVLDNRYEKEFTLDWALRLQSLLEANHCRAFLTRSNDTDLALSNRVAFAARHRADLFVSLHFNSAAPNESEAGLETYCLTPAGMPSNLTRGFPDELNQIFPNNAFDAQNLWLALRIHRALLQVNGHHDRGIRRARFPGVLRGQQQPAVLIEGGYLSNPQEARLIQDPAYRQRLAEALAKALVPEAAASVVALRSAQNDAPQGPVALPANDTNSDSQISEATAIRGPAGGQEGAARSP